MLLQCLNKMKEFGIRTYTTSQASSHRKRRKKIKTMNILLHKLKKNNLRKRPKSLNLTANAQLRQLIFRPISNNLLPPVQNSKHTTQHQVLQLLRKSSPAPVAPPKINKNKKNYYLYKFIRFIDARKSKN